MKNQGIISAVIFSLLLSVLGCKQQAEEKHEGHTTETHQDHAAEKADLAMNYYYQCPMDCEDGKTYEEEGSCPVCKMDLKKMDKEHSEDHDKSKDHKHENDETHDQ